MSDMVYIEDSGQLKLDRANKLLAGIGDGKLLRNAIYNAMNRAGTRALKQSATFASQRYAISASGFKSHSKTKYHIQYGAGKLSGGVVSAEISFAGSVIPLIQFHPRFSRDGGVNVTVKKGQGGNLAHAFVTNINGTNVYERQGPARLPIERKFGPSTAHMMMDDQVQTEMDKTIADTFNTRIEHEITRILNGWGG